MIGDPGNLAGDEQATARLRVGEQEALAFIARPRDRPT